MADYPAEVVNTTGTALTERSGTASADTVPAGAIVIFRNTGAGSHDVTLANNATQDGLAVSARTVAMAASAVKVVRVNPLWGDANGRVGLTIANATPSELKFYVLGGV